MSNDKNKDNVNDVFEEAAKLALSKSTVKKVVVEKAIKENSEITKEQKEQALDLTVNNNITPWDKLKGKINKEYATRAMAIMEELPDREFLKTYLKLQEYVNPKIVRKEVIEDKEENNEIKITVYQQNNFSPNGEDKIIDVTED